MTPSFALALLLIVTAAAATPPTSPSAAAAAEAQRLYIAVGSFAGATEVASDPSAGGVLAQKGSGAPYSRQLVDHTAYYTLPGTLQEVAGAVYAHLPEGSAKVYPGLGVGSFDATTALYPVKAGVALEGARLALASTSDANRVALRVDAWAIAQPPRPSTERLPRGVTSSSVLSVAPQYVPFNPNAGIPGNAPAGPTTAISTVRAVSAVEALVNWFNRRPPAPPYRLVCPGIYPNPLYLLRFRTKAGTVWTVQEDGCGDLAVRIGNKTAPALSEGYVLGAGIDPTSEMGLEPLLARLHALGPPVEPCTAKNLTVYYATPTAALGFRTALPIVFRNTSSTTCAVQGVPGVAFQDSRHAPLPTRVNPPTGTFPAVTMTPGYLANIVLFPSPTGSSCDGPDVAYVLVTLANTSSTITVTVGQGSVPFNPCQGDVITNAIAG